MEQTSSEIRAKMVEKGYQLESNGTFTHRKNYVDRYGRIPRGWVVHHIDNNHLNNNPVNLIALPNSVHRIVHAIRRRNGHVLSRKTIIEMGLQYWDDVVNGRRIIQTKKQRGKLGKRRKRKLKKKKRPRIYTEVMRRCTPAES